MTSAHWGEFLGVPPSGEIGTYSSIHRIVGGKITDKWSLGSLLEMLLPAIEREIRERERVEQELEVGPTHPASLALPTEVPTLEDWQIAPFYQPAREVGGDFYDFHLLSEGRLGLVVGDATGKLAVRSAGSVESHTPIMGKSNN